MKKGQRTKNILHKMQNVFCIFKKGPFLILHFATRRQSMRIVVCLFLFAKVVIVRSSWGEKQSEEKKGEITKHRENS